jgi:hypothetical protein
MVSRGRHDHGPREPVVNAAQHLSRLAFAVVMTGGESRAASHCGSLLSD